jgi:membrane protease YdiL (CAAX protease family)
MWFTLAIVGVVLTYTWVIDPMAPAWVAGVAGTLVIGLAVWRAFKTGEWGLERSAFLPALGWSAAITGAGALAMYVAGSRLETWKERRDVWSTLAVLIPWALGQQFALQTVLLRESQATVSRSAGIWLAALLFASLHLPNPFLSVATFAGALAWCRVYDRHPNLLPLALSHAILTLAILYAFDDAMTGGLRVGYAYLEGR